MLFKKLLSILISIAILSTNFLPLSKDLFFTSNTTINENSNNNSQVFADNGVTSRKNLIAVLVDSKLFNDVNLSLQIQDYVQSIWDRVHDTNTVIYKVSNLESQSSIFEKLEKLYFSWEIIWNIESHLSWIILVWNIKLPLVSMRDWLQEKVSIFPYTDFEDKYFVFNGEKNIFTRQYEVSTPNAEVWHWLIRPVESEINNLNFYKKYFEKLKSYYSWNIQTQNWMFFTDLEEERKSINQDLFNQYKISLKYQKQIANKQYTSEFLNVLTNNFLWWINENKNVKINKDLLSTFIDNDVFSINQIKKFLPEYTDVVKWYVEQANDLIDFTWKFTKNNTDFLPKLISLKDNLFRLYTKALSDILEEEIISFIKNNWQQDISVPENISNAIDCSNYRWSPKDKFLSKQIDIRFSEALNGLVTSPVDLQSQATYIYCDNLSDKKVKKISSIIIHNEPSDKTLSRILDSASSISIPVDWRHVISFKWKNWPIILTLPDLFWAGDMRQYLFKYINYFKSIQKKDWVLPELNWDFFDNIINKSEPYYIEHIQWDTLSIDWKYKKILIDFLFNDKPMEITSESSDPYLFAYLRNESLSWDRISFDSFDKSNESKNQKNNMEQYLEKIKKSSNITNSKLEEKCWPINWVPLPQWFEAIQCWIEDLKNFQFEACWAWWDLDFENFLLQSEDNLKDFWDRLDKILSQYSWETEGNLSSWNNINYFANNDIKISPNKIVSVLWKKEEISFNVFNKLNWSTEKSFSNITIFTSSWIDILEKDLNSDQAWIQISRFSWDSKIIIQWNQVWNYFIEFMLENLKTVKIPIEIKNNIWFKVTYNWEKLAPGNQYHTAFFNIETIDNNWFHVDYNWPVYLKAHRVSTVLQDVIVNLNNWSWFSAIASKTPNVSFLISAEYFESKKITINFQNKKDAETNWSWNDIRSQNEINEIDKNDIRKSNFISWYFIWSDFANIENGIVYDLISKENAITIASNFSSDGSILDFEMGQKWIPKFNNDIYWIWITDNSNYQFYLYDKSNLKDVWTWDAIINSYELEINEENNDVINVKKGVRKSFVYYKDILLASFSNDGFNIFDSRISTDVNMQNGNIEVNFEFDWNPIFSLKINNLWIKNIIWDFKNQYWKYFLLNKVEMYGNQKWTEKSVFWNWFLWEEKSILKLSSWQSFGESLQSENWIFSVTIWDPTFKINNQNQSNKWYDTSIWKEVLSLDKTIINFKIFDYNNDSIDDIVYYTDDYRIWLLEWINKNIDWKTSFINRWDIASYWEVILSFAVWDLNSDWNSDIVVALNNGHLKFLENKWWKFLNKFISLNIWNNKIMFMDIEDMNKDWRMDLIVSDALWNIIIFYWKQFWITSNPFRIYWSNVIDADFSFSIDKYALYPEIILSSRQIKLVPIWNWENGYTAVRVDFEKIDIQARANDNQSSLWDIISTNKSNWGIWSNPNYDKPSDWEDSLNDKIWEINNQLRDLNSKIWNLTCIWWSCFSAPYNYAFNVPWKITVPSVLEAIWIPIWPVVWSPLFWTIWCPAWPCPCSWPLCYSSAWLNRFYISPTLTWWAWIAYCTWAQPDPTWNSKTWICYASAIPVNDAWICKQEDLMKVTWADKLVNNLNSSSNKFFNSYVTNGNREQVNDAYWVKFEGFNIGVFEPKNKTTQSLFSWFFTKWADQQIEEISNKLLSMPTLRLILPDIAGSFNSFSNKMKTDFKLTDKDAFDKFNKQRSSRVTRANSNEFEWKQSVEKWASSIRNSFDYFFNEVQKIPFLTLNKEKTVFNIPWINPSRLGLITSEIENWLKDSKKEISSKVAAWWSAAACANNWDIKTNSYISNKQVSKDCKNAQDLIDASSAIRSVENELKTLKSYAEFPNKLLKYKNWLAGYFNQVIDILDCFTDLMNWWLNRNKTRAEKYIELWYTITGIIIQIQNLDLIFQDYKDTCEPCKANTYLANFQLADIFFSVVPSPPLIKFPKWPDIVFNLSDIQAWVAITIPEPDFKLKEIIFYLDLPPLSIDNLHLPTLPHFPSLPLLPELPDLPSISIPKLPDLPPPPSLPELPWFFFDFWETIRLVYKLYCFIFEKWLFVYPENTLKGIIEWLTNRSSRILLPSDYFFLQSPNVEYSSIDEINVNTHLNLDIKPKEDLSKILKDVAKEWNSIDTDLRNDIYQFNSTINNSINEKAWDIQKNIDDSFKEFQEDINKNLDLKNKQSYNPIHNKPNINSVILADDSGLSWAKSSFLPDSVSLINNAISVWFYYWDKNAQQIRKFINYENQWDNFISPVEINNWLWAIYSIGNSLFYKDYKTSSPANDTWNNQLIIIKDFNEINVNHSSVNLFKSENIWNDLELSWKDEGSIDAYLIEIKDLVYWFDSSSKNSSRSLFYLIKKSGLYTNLIADLRINSTVIVKDFSEPRLDITLNDNWYFTQISPLISGWKIWTNSSQRLLYKNDVWQFVINPIEMTEKQRIPILIPNKISSSEEENEVVSWDLDNNWSYEYLNNEVLLPSRQKLETFVIRAKITNFDKWTINLKKVEIETFAPSVSLDPYESDFIYWSIDPPIANYPISLLVDRNSNFSVYWEQIFTDENWMFKIEKSKVKDFKRIYDSQNNTIAIINLLNKKIIPSIGYEIWLSSSKDNNFSKISIFKENVVVANIFTKINNANIIEYNWSLDNKNDTNVIFVRDLNLQDSIKILKINDSKVFNNWVAIYDWSKILALISKSWEVKLSSDTSFKIKDNADSGFVFQVIYQWVIIYEIYIWVDLDNITIWGLIDKTEETLNIADMIQFIFQIVPKAFAESWDETFVVPSKNNNDSDTPKSIWEIKDLSSQWILPFGDILNDNPAKNSILELYRRNIITWYWDKTFRPDNKISRAEFVKIVLWATNCEDCTRPTIEEKREFILKPFPDVAIYDWFFNCISKAKKLKMVTWYLNDGLFRPNKFISRWESVSILLRQAKVPIHEFKWEIKDIYDYHWFKDYVQTAIDIWLIVQKNWLVNPLEEITRWEFALITTRLLELVDCQQKDDNNNWILDYLEKENGTWENKWYSEKDLKWKWDIDYLWWTDKWSWFIWSVEGWNVKNLPAESDTSKSISSDQCIFIQDVNSKASNLNDLKIYWIIISEDRKTIFSKSKEFTR